MPVGTVKFFNINKGFGFIAQDDGQSDAFVHISAVERAGFSGLRENQRVAYDLEGGRDGRASAVNLRAAEYRDSPGETVPSGERARTSE